MLVAFPLTTVFAFQFFNGTLYRSMASQQQQASTPIQA